MKHFYTEIINYKFLNCLKNVNGAAMLHNLWYRYQQWYWAVFVPLKSPKSWVQTIFKVKHKAI